MAAVTLKHRFQSTKALGPDATKVRSDPWNDDHPLSGGTLGDLLYRDTAQDATSGASWLTSVVVGRVLVSGGVGTAPAWSASPSLTSLTLSTPLPVASGGTAMATGTPGDILYFSGTGTIAKLADVAIGSVLVSGGVGVAPAWASTVALTGTLAVGTTAVAGAALTVAGGDIAFANDNTNNLGQSGARRPAVVFVGTGVALGANPASTGSVRLPNGGVVQARNAANDANVAVLSVDASNIVTLGDNSFATKLKGTTVQWGPALIAMGGGAAPTVGTIGGSGPATAAQNTWLKALDSTGAAIYIPVWK